MQLRRRSTSQLLVLGAFLLAGATALPALAVRAAAGGVFRRVTARVALVALIITIGYGAFDEIHQWFVPGRSAELADWYADSIGAFAGVAASWAWGIIRLRVDV